MCLVSITFDFGHKEIRNKLFYLHYSVMLKTFYLERLSNNFYIIVFHTFAKYWGLYMTVSLESNCQTVNNKRWQGTQV